MLNRIKNIPIKIFLRKKLYRLLSDELINSVDDVIEAQKEVISYNSIKQALCIDAIEKLMFASAEKKIAIIGDGNGFMGLLLKNLYQA